MQAHRADDGPADVLSIARQVRLTLALTAALVGAWGGVTRAAPSVHLAATLTPEHLGQPATVGLKVRIRDPGTALPPPLTRLEVSYPRRLGVALSGLGLVTCSVSTLERSGPRACPSQSWLGTGRAVAAVPIGPVLLRESADVAIVRAPGKEQMSLLFYVTGDNPVISEASLPGALTPAQPPFGGAIQVNLPLLAGLPGGPDAAVVSLTATLGPRSLTYYDRVGRRFVPYRPRGILLPKHCPPGGFPFAANVTFLDSARATARTSVPCPRGSR